MLRPVVVGGRQGVLLQDHPRPWPVAKLRTLRVPARKVQHRWNVLELRGVVARFGHKVLVLAASRLRHSRSGRKCAASTPVLGRSAIKSRVPGGASHTAFDVSTPR